VERRIALLVQNILAAMSVGRRELRITHRMQPLADTRVLRPTQMALALKLVTEMDLLRLKTIARLHARGLPPDVGWEDLLQEALTRVLTGARRIPEQIAPVAFIAGVMRSLRSEHWRRAGGAGARYAASDYRAYRTRELALKDSAPDPERSLIAIEELEAIERLFADDRIVLGIIDALGEGLSPEQIRSALALSKTDYDSARRRLRRCLLREGLTCGPK
jgi:DNA-directed RNA polymerase specialized sigma24 family protein